MANIARFDPFESTFDNLFRAFLQPMEWERRQASIPMDIWETEKAYYISAELPGVKKEDIQVSIYENQVTISAEAKQEKEASEEASALLTERAYGKMTRSVMLPVEIDENSAQARHEDGVLHLLLPKKPESLAKRLTVN